LSRNLNGTAPGEDFTKDFEIEFEEEVAWDPDITGFTLVKDMVTAATYVMKLGLMDEWEDDDGESQGVDGYDMTLNRSQWASSTHTGAIGDVYRLVLEFTVDREIGTDGFETGLEVGFVNQQASADYWTELSDVFPVDEDEEFYPGRTYRRVVDIDLILASGALTGNTANQNDGFTLVFSIETGKGYMTATEAGRPTVTFTRFEIYKED
jgi:hypothetical protein